MNTIIVIFISVLVSTTTANYDAQPGRGKAFMDDGTVTNEPHLPAQMFNGAAVLVDSACPYSAWTQAQECLSYNPNHDGLQLVCRSHYTYGLNVSQTNGTFSFWIYDVSVNNSNAARYPTSCATDGPHICYPLLEGGNWGIMGAQYESGGWWSSIWDIPVSFGNRSVHKVIGKQLSNGNMLFIGYTISDDIIYCTTSEDLQTVIDSNTVTSGYYYWGFDYNGGIGYMFYYDDSLNIYYRSTTDGVTWSPHTQYNMIWPEPYVNNLLFWTQCAVTDSGNPILVFDLLDSDDYSTGTYPYLATTFISRAEGQPCISASAPYTKAWYPTVATGGNTVVVLYHVARAGSGIDSLAFQDIVAAVSIDGGNSFTEFINLTSTLTHRPGLAQLAKRIDLNRGNFFYFYTIDQFVNHDPIYHCWRDPEGLDEMYYYVGWNEMETCIEEEPKQNAGAQYPRLSIYPNPFSTKTAINYALSSKHYKDKDKPTINIYDACGRKVKSFLLPTAYSLLPTVIQWHGDDDHGKQLPRGVYFVKLRGENLSAVDKVIKVK